MKHRLFFVSPFLFVLASFGQDLQTDTSKVYQQPEVVVTATRSVISIYDSPSQIDLLTRNDMVNIGGSSVADIFKNSEGIFLNDNGGISSLKTVSIRGTASQHFLVLVNGNRFNSMDNGLAYLNLLSLNDIQQIEIVHGGNSALYGADALGGVMNIITKQAERKLQSRIEGSIGSFGYQKYLLEGGGRITNLGLIAGYSVERGRDDYNFNFTRLYAADTTLKRQNADFLNRQLYLHTDLTPDQKFEINISTQYVNSDFGVPGSLSFFTPTARQKDNDLNISVKANDKHVTDLQITSTLGFHYDLMKYNDPNPYYPIYSYYKNIFMNCNTQIIYNVAENQRFIFGGEVSKGRLWSNDFDAKISRNQIAAYLSSESSISFDRITFDRISLYQTIRYDRISDVGFAIVPKLGINVRFVREGDIRFRSSVGQNYRSPSFNDLYFRGFSNPKLKSEHSTSFDAGFISHFNLNGEHTGEITYFNLNTTDRIILDQTTYIPENIGKAVSNGIELKYDGKYFGNLVNLGMNYSFTDARKKNRDYSTDSTYNMQIVAVPKELFNINLSVSYRPITVNLNYSSVGKRFTKSDNSLSLPSYNLVSANIILRPSLADFGFFIKGDINNLFNKYYQAIKDYPTPGRNFRLTVGINY